MVVSPTIVKAMLDSTTAAIVFFDLVTAASPIQRILDFDEAEPTSRPFPGSFAIQGKWFRRGVKCCFALPAKQQSAQSPAASGEKT